MAIPVEFLGVRIYMIIASSIALIFSLLGFYAAYKKKATQDNVIVRNIKKFTLGTIVFYFLIEVLFWSIDPWSVYEIIPLDITIWCSPPLPVILIAFGAVLFHWVEFYHVSIAALKEKEMLRKVNSAYQGEVTLEEMIMRVGTIKRFQIPFAIVATIGIIVRTIHSVMTFRVKGSSKAVVAVDLAFFAVCWAALTVAYLIYGRRLVDLMPPQFSPKVRKFTRKVTIVSILNFVVFMVVIALDAAYYENVFKTPKQLIIMFFLIHKLPMFVMLLLLSLYMKFDWRITHCVGLKSSSGSSRTSVTAPSKDDASSHMSHSSASELEVTVFV